MENELVDLWEGATFMPHDHPARSDVLLEKVWKSRQAKFLAFSLKLLANEPELCKETGFAECLVTFKNIPAGNRLQLIEYPPFVIWLKQNIRALSCQADLKERVADLKRVMAAFEANSVGTDILRMEGRQIQVVRFEVDPLISQAAFPEYRFPDTRRRREFEEKGAYPLSFFIEMLSLALTRIERTWPEAHRDFWKYVRIVVDMIDGDYTSYSACDHIGVIFVSTDNSPLIALEEFLIHEFGHQVLYNVMELEPLVRDDLRGTYKLPWSGNERDFYGYFHAFYIYILLARYYQRMEGRSLREQKRRIYRITEIVKGLVRAIPELEAANGFTPRGQQLLENLKAEVQSLRTAQKLLYSEIKDTDPATRHNSQIEANLHIQNESIDVNTMRRHAPELQEMEAQ